MHSPHEIIPLWRIFTSWFWSQLCCDLDGTIYLPTFWNLFPFFDGILPWWRLFHTLKLLWHQPFECTIPHISTALRWCSLYNLFLHHWRIATSAHLYFLKMLGWPSTLSCILVFMIPVLVSLKGSLSGPEWASEVWWSVLIRGKITADAQFLTSTFFWWIDRDNPHLSDSCLKEREHLGQYTWDNCVRFLFMREFSHFFG